MTTPNPYIPAPNPDDRQTPASQPYAYGQGTNGAQQPYQNQTYQEQTHQQPYQGQAYQQTQQQQPYGAPYMQQPAYYYQPTQERWNVICIIGFILAFIIPPAGLILSIIALVQINKSHEKSRGLSIAGIVLGALGTLFIVLVFALIVWAIGFTFDYAERHPEIWDDADDFSQIDGQICFRNGTCIDTQDLPRDFEWHDAFDETDWSQDTDRFAFWQTAQGSVPIDIELVG